MSEPFVGEIRMFAATFAPRGWAFCNGQLLAISQNNALFSLFGTTYGGDGRTTFGLPEARGRVALHQGQGPGLSSRNLGSKGGVENVVVNTNQLPVHSHALQATALAGQDSAPGGSIAAQSTADVYRASPPVASLVDLNASTIGNVGGGQQHTNIQPFLGINCIVALFGFFPSRN